MCLLAYRALLIMDTITQPDTTQWLEEKIKAYRAEVEKLEAQLKHAKILLHGHEIWLTEVKKKAGENGHN